MSEPAVSLAFFDPESELHGTMPALEWQPLGSGESIRGYVDFVLPKSAKGLTLVYSGVSGKAAQPLSKKKKFFF